MNTRTIKISFDYAWNDNTFHVLSNCYMGTTIALIYHDHIFIKNY